MGKEEAAKLWLEGEKRDKKMAEDVFEMRHYDWALFFWQLTLEKALKALLTQKDKTILLIHDLLKLAMKAELELTETEKDELREITTFNTEARYENEKYAFYKKATRKYADVWVKICKKMYKKLLKEVENG